MHAYATLKTIERASHPFAAPQPLATQGAMPRGPVAVGLSPAEIRQIILDLMG